jgi:alpha-tubulin suppressor-like RCC1 family protein
VALLQDGGVRAWGEHNFGPETATDVRAIAAGARHAIVLLADGAVMAWGDNGSGQCSIPAGLPLVVEVFAGGDGSAAVDRSGKLHVWGRVPEDVKGLSNAVRSIAIGTSTCLVLSLAPVTTE